MIRIKLKNKEGKIKYVTKGDDFPVEVGESIRMKWQVLWEVVSIKIVKKK